MSRNGDVGGERPTICRLTGRPAVDHDARSEALRIHTRNVPPATLSPCVSKEIQSRPHTLLKFALLMIE